MSKSKLGKIGLWLREYHYSLFVLFIILLIIGFRSGRFSGIPEIEVFPDNVYEKTLHAVANNNNSPYTFIDENGKGQGFDVELVTFIANKLQMNLVIDYLPWDECIARITDHEADLLLTCDYSSNFGEGVNLIKTQPVSEDDFVVYSRKKITSVPELKNLKTAISPDTNVVQKMHSLQLTDNGIVCEDNVSTMKALLSGEADCAIIRQSVGAVLLRELRKEGLQTDVKAYLKVGDSPMCLAIDGKNGELESQINRTVDIFKLDGTIDALKEKWLTTFVRPYSFVEVLEMNRWVVFLLILFVVFTINAFFNNKRRWLKEQERELKKEQMMQQQIQDALAEAQKANEAKTVFLSNMSHDIRTPMNAIMGYTKLALNHIDDTELVRGYLEKTRLSSTHLLSLINDVLDMSRIESGKMMLSEKEENLQEIVHSLEEIVQVDVDAKKLSLSVHCEELQDEIVICDKLHLNQVLLNVLSNAIKYTPEGGAVSLTVSQKRHWGKKSGTCRFVIKDNGIGMSSDYLKTVFEPFTREKTATVSGIQGTGLGMSIAKKIVDMMGGKFEIQSEPGKGTEVILTFVFRIGQETETVSAGKKSEKESGKQNFEGRKLLLVEDNEFNREITTEILEGYGFVIDTAEDGSVALEKVAAASAGAYDLILMDIQMPVMNGYEATRKIRALNTEISHIPIVAMTANAFEEDRKMALEAGMNDHVAKPIDFGKLKQTLSKYLI
ncbi:MAG: response regulator [Treponema sp.]|nr:response regulator [Candidatus Treponema caballi]